MLADLGRGGTIDRERIHSKSKMTPWHGFETTARLVRTMVRGRTVMEDGVLVGPEGWGRPVPQSMPEPRPRNLDKTMEAIVRKPPGGGAAG